MKRFISVLLVCLITCATALFGSNVQSVKAAEISDFMSDEVIQYVKDNENLFIEVMLNYAHHFNIEKRDADKYYLAKPYLIYLLVENQDEIYYYPIVDSVTGKIVANVGVFSIDSQYTYEIQTEHCDILNEINYTNTDVILYMENGIVYAATNERSIFANSDGKIFEKGKSYRTTSYDIDVIKSNLKSLKSATRSTLSANEKLHAIMESSNEITLTNPRGQYSYNMCWASSAATVINHLKSSSITGFDVCNRVGISYNAGGNMYDVQDGLWLYGVSYSNMVDGGLTWMSVVSNIDSNKPAVMGAEGSNGVWHATVLSGYSYINNNYSIIMWDPYYNNGNGGSRVISFSGEGYTLDSIVYTWETSLSYL